MDFLKRNHTRFFKLVSLALLGLFLCEGCKGPQEKFSAQEVSESKSIPAEVEEGFWQHLLEESIYLRWKRGLEIHRLPDLSYAYAKSEYDFSSSLLERLDEVRPELLSHEEWLDAEVLKWELETAIEGMTYFWFSFPVTPYSSFLPVIHRIFSTYKFSTPKDLDSYFELLKKYPVFISQMQDRIEVQQGKGIIIPREELELVLPFLKSFIREGRASLFYVQDQRLQIFEPEVRLEFQKKLIEIILSGINPVLGKLVDFLQTDYRNASPASVGLWQYPGGKDYYRYLIRYYTSLELEPEEIHQTGLEWVKKNNEKVDEIRQSLKHEGSLSKFLRFLKTDPGFVPKNAEEIGERLESYVDAVRDKLSAYFLRLPKAPCGVQRLDPVLEAAMTFGYYQEPNPCQPLGIYYFNGSNLSNMYSIGAEGLIYHELVPGHHLEICLHRENEALSDFRREIFHSAYSEGWAEYSSWLGMEMGLYRDPYSLCGRYLSDSFFSARLVVDTGMNYLGWPRSRAVKFMQDNLLESDGEIHTETLRYSCDIPGQALAYKLGCIKMFELREKAKKALGDKFDIKRFHHAVLGYGSLPLAVLERHLDWFVGEELKKR
jgi:uncharacterized protein (DUF885 family)